MNKETSFEETYIQVFGAKGQGHENQLRIGFLQTVVSGKIPGTQNSIEDALKNENELLEKAEKDSDIIVTQKEISELQAMQAMREWYLQAEKVQIYDAKQEILPELTDAQLPYITNSIDDCMKVLYKHRIASLKTIFDNSFKTNEKCRDKAVRATAEMLLKSNNEEIRDYVITVMAKYQAGLKRTLDKALVNNNAKAIQHAAEKLEKTGVASLQEYALRIR